MVAHQSSQETEDQQSEYEKASTSSVHTDIHKHLHTRMQAGLNTHTPHMGAHACPHTRTRTLQSDSEHAHSSSASPPPPPAEVPEADKKLQLVQQTEHSI